MKKVWQTRLLSVTMLLLATTLLSSCGFEVVDTGRRGIKVNLGKVVGDPLPEGLHFYNPFTSDIREFNVREEKWNDSTIMFTRDTQQVTVEFTVTYYADPKFVTKIYQDVGDEYALTEKIIKPVVLGSLKDAIGQVIADELVGKRETVTRSALTEVKESLAARHVIVSDLQFTNLDFNDAYESAVEAKAEAVQHALKAKNETVRIREEAEQKVLTAKAEAEAMRIKTQALAQSKGLVEFEAVQKWDGKLPVNMYGGAPIPFINLKKE